MTDQAQTLAEEALKEAQATVRSYDTKAQIVGIGYIFALGVVGRIEERFQATIETGVPFVILSWATLVLPAVLFGLVLYPSRKLIAKGTATGVLYVRDGDFASTDDYIAAARKADPMQETAAELLKVSQLRERKRVRFLRALFAAGASLVTLLSLHFFRAVS